MRGKNVYHEALLSVHRYLKERIISRFSAGPRDIVKVKGKGSGPVPFLDTKRRHDTRFAGYGGLMPFATCTCKLYGLATGTHYRTPSLCRQSPNVPALSSRSRPRQCAEYSSDATTASDGTIYGCFRTLSRSQLQISCHITGFR
jgi:hypothetical protein